MMNQRMIQGMAVASAILGLLQGCGRSPGNAPQRPNILFCITDDQTWLHCSAYGSRFVSTPNFDRLAREGILFSNAFVSVPSCNPSRSSVLTGQDFYRLREASMNHNPWPEGLTTYADWLSDAGYFVGYTGKGCAPTDWHAGGRSTNPAGPAYNAVRTEGETDGMVGAKIDYAGNFEAFLKERPEHTPFCFWFGSAEPHRVFQEGIGLRKGKKLTDVELPGFYPESDEIRSDMLDYAVHIEWVDKHLGRMLKTLEDIGELDHTLIVFTSDNGMPFPRCKATCYEWGIHMPLAIRWGDVIKGGRVVYDFVSFTDFAPTFLEAAQADIPESVTGRSLMPIFKSGKSGRIDPERDHIIAGVERHFPGGREGGWGYPVRAIRTEQYLYIHNYAPDRWPAGDPEGPVWPADDPTGGFGDCDGSPTKTYLVEHKKDQPYYYNLAFAKNPSEELYDVKKDPYQLTNLAGDPQFGEIKSNLRRQLDNILLETDDPRATGRGAELDQYALDYQKPL
jgi:N-sulfoglucosamine sulfohydrolase